MRPDNPDWLSDVQLDDLGAAAELHGSHQVGLLVDEVRTYRERRANLERTCLLTVRPGDVLVVRCEHRLPDATKAWIGAKWRDILPGTQVVVQDNCLELLTVRPDRTPEQQR